MVDGSFQFRRAFQSLVKAIQGPVSAQIVADVEAEYLTGIHVHQNRQVENAFGGVDIGDVGADRLVGTGYGYSLDQVFKVGVINTGDRRANLPVTPGQNQAAIAQDPVEFVTADPNPQVGQLMPQLADAVSRMRRPDLKHLVHNHLLVFRNLLGGCQGLIIPGLALIEILADGAHGRFDRSRSSVLLCSGDSLESEVFFRHR